MVVLAFIVYYGTHVVKEELVVTRHFGFLLVVRWMEVRLLDVGEFFLGVDKISSEVT